MVALIMVLSFGLWDKITLKEKLSFIVDQVKLSFGYCNQLASRQK
jgi:hypothetical protein